MAASSLPLDAWALVACRLDWGDRLRLAAAVPPLFRDRATWEGLRVSVPRPWAFEVFSGTLPHMGLRRRLVRWAAFQAAPCWGCGWRDPSSETFALGVKLCSWCRCRLLEAGVGPGPYCWLRGAGGKRERHRFIEYRAP